MCESNRKPPTLFGKGRSGRPMRKSSVFQVLRNAEYSGRSFTRCSQVNGEILFDSDKTQEFTALQNIHELDDEGCHLGFNTDLVLSICKNIFANLTNFEARRTHEDRYNQEDIHSQYARHFVRYGGAEIVLRVLMLCSSLPQEALAQADSPDPAQPGVTPLVDFNQTYFNDEQLRVKSVCLDILCRLLSVKDWQGGLGEGQGMGVMNGDEHLDYLFSLLCQEKTFLTSCQFLEDILQASKHVLNLNHITNIRPLVQNLCNKKLANFCRVLAVTISDLDIYEHKSSLYAQNKQKRMKGFVNVRDVNQELLLGIPDLIPRLVQIAIARDYTPRYQGMASELDNWMEWIENSMADEAFDAPQGDDLENFIGGVSAMASRTGPLVQQSGLRISTDLILRVQVVYVLGLFLVGKHRKKVQRKLAELHLIPGLSELFEQFIWKCQAHRNNTRHRLRGHNSSCECSPEVALKIQFLRLVHSFCDHSDYKHLLLSKSELNEVKRINSRAESSLMVDGLDDINKSMMCRGSKGLLTKVVDVMKKEPTASTFRFWLARAVESYLRGSTSYCDQIFLLRRGLLQHIAGNIVEHDIRPKEILQSSFDLLGELIKFNFDAFGMFDQVLDTDAKFEKFISTVKRSLVDSNMFIRALILSFEHFTSTKNNHKAEYARNKCRLMLHVSRFDLQMEYLQRLINLISVQNLTQENVSCLNTTLVFLMFANQKEQLPRYLQGLLQLWAMESSPPPPTTSSSSNAKVPPALPSSTVALANSSAAPSSTCSSSDSKILQNFRDLLIFWQDHYLHKDKDCSALERSSRIPFDFWKETVTTLVADNPDDPRAILHYLDMDTDRPS